MRQSWTDDRLDDFRAESARRFDEVDRRFDKVDERFETLERKVGAGFERLNDRMDALHRTLLQLCGGTFVALLGILVTQL